MMRPHPRHEYESRSADLLLSRSLLQQGSSLEFNEAILSVMLE